VGSLIHWFSRNHVAANFLMLVIMIIGLLTWMRLKKEIFPETAVDAVAISVPYPNASPEETETGVCVPIEEAIQDIDGLDRITSTATESAGVVVVEIKSGYDVRNIMDDIKTRIDAITTFAENTEQPIIEELLIRNQVLSVAVSAETDEKTLQSIAEKIRDGLLSYSPREAVGVFEKFKRLFGRGVDNPITQVELTGVRPYEISIEVSEDTLRSHQLTLEQVAAAVRKSSLDLPGGSVRTAAGEVLIKAEGKRYRDKEFLDIPVFTRPDGSELLLGAIAKVIDGFEEVDMKSRFDTRSAIVVNVYRVGNEDTLRVAEAVEEYIKQARLTLPEGVAIEMWFDQSKALKGRMNLLARNGVFGLLLVFGVLALFLRPSLAFLVSVGIPVSFAGAVAMMPYTDISINMITLFAFILVLGIVVDDAIVVGENVYRRIRLGEDPRDAAWKGTHEVGVVVIFGVLTTVVAFMPMLAVSGVGGKIWRNIPWIVIPTLLFSLLQSKLILPSHMALLRKTDPNREFGPLMRLQRSISHGLETFVERSYQPVLRVAIRNRYPLLAGFVTIFILVMSLVAGGWVRWQFFPEMEADMISAKVTMPKGVPFETTERAVLRIEKAAEELNRKFTSAGQKPLIKHMLASTGSQPFQTEFAVGGPPAGDNLGQVTLELRDADDRQKSANELAAVWRELTGPIPGTAELTFQSQAAGGGNAIDLLLRGDDLDELERAAEFVKGKLNEIQGVIDIADSNREGKREMKLKRRLLPAGEALGLRVSDVANQLRRAFYGDEVQRMQRGRDEVKVFVRYPKDERLSLENVEQMKVRTATGEEVPLSEVAEFELGRGYSAISRADRKRSIKVTADVDKTRANAEQVVEKLQVEALDRFPDLFSGVAWSFEGEQKNQRDDVKQIGIGFFLALIAMFVLMAIPLKSYIQPLIIMSVIPFGLVGAVLGHILMGASLSIMSLCGIVALAGVVVNDSLVLVDYVNRQRHAGVPVAEAAWQAGGIRFRPILLTSLTTFAGLSPMLLETDLQAQFLIPMAISLGFGILFATVITLFLVPCIYLMLEDVKKLFFTQETIAKWEKNARDQHLHLGEEY
jgi:multidrug efflux pump subunit AcrB